MSHEYNLKPLLDAILKRCNMTDYATREQVTAAYNEVVGPFLVQLTRSLNYQYESHTLVVSLASPALRQELTYKTSDLIAAINKKLNKREVWKIIFA